MHIHIDTYTKPNEYRRTVMMTLLSPRNYKEETRLEYYKEDKKTIIEKHIYDKKSIITDASVFTDVLIRHQNDIVFKLLLKMMFNTLKKSLINIPIYYNKGEYTMH